jgi:hypothetical protein
MHFVMFPSQTLSNSNPPPLLLCQQTQRTRVILIEVLLWNHLEQLFGQDNMSVLEFVIRITIGVVNPVEGDE